MAQTTVAPTTTNRIVSNLDAQRSANEYLAMNVAASLRSINGVFVPLDRPLWQFAIQLRMAKQELAIMGVIDVDATTGQVLPLNDEVIETILDRTSTIAEHHRTETWHKRHPGTSPPPQVKRISVQVAQANANRYLASILDSRLTALNGAYMPTGRPVWLFDVRHKQSEQDVAVITVNAVTGDVILLSDEQIQEILHKV